MSIPIGDPRKPGETGAAGDPREGGAEGVAGDPRETGQEASGGTYTVSGSGGDAELKGAELDQALEDAGLPKTGTAKEKRERLAEAQSA